MKKIYYKLTFLSDIVLQGSSNTLGKVETLDYITGSSILGIVAKNYDKFENPIDIFHSKKVRFGQASLLSENKECYKAPLCFFAPKEDFDKQEVKNNHFIDYKNQEELDKQYKQIRTGYINSNLDYLNLDFTYTQKAAYDKKNRKSEDGKMYGYNSIQKGTSWIFSLKIDDTINQNDKKLLEDSLVGVRYLGKSKSSSYGKVKIEELKDYKLENIENPITTGVNYIYVKSSLALFDENDMSTFIPTKESLALENAKIVWEETQIKTKTFTPYNSIRECFDFSRNIIQRGSVIALKNISPKDIETLKKGIGAYLNEGYGEVLINPSFLLKEDKFCLNKKDIVYEKIENEISKIDDDLVAFLNNKSEISKKTLTLVEEVEKYIEENKNSFKGVSKSQWGQIRAYTQFHKESYREKIKDFISHGISEKQWKDAKEKLEKLLDEKSLEFIKLFSMTMPKKDLEK